MPERNVEEAGFGAVNGLLGGGKLRFGFFGTFSRVWANAR